jgi:hypothetical protein
MTKTEVVKIESRNVAINPEMAANWLEINKHNRKLRASVVQRYAEDMKSGSWQRTHQGIAFDEDGNLVDGQHRLAAIVESGVTVNIMVTTGLPHGTYMLDGGFGRTVKDQLLLSDFDLDQAILTKKMVAIVNAYIQLFVNGEATPKKSSAKSVGEFLVRYEDECLFMRELINQNPTVKGISVQGAMTGIFSSVMAGIDRAKLEDFTRILLTGMGGGELDYPIIGCRNALMRDEAKNSSVYVHEKIRRVQYAITKYLDGSTSGASRVSKELIWRPPVLK